MKTLEIIRFSIQLTHDNNYIGEIELKQAKDYFKRKGIKIKW